MNRTALVVGGVVAALVLLALVAPAMIDWSRQKERIVAKLEEITGRKVEIAGRVRLRLLPSPVFTAESLSIANPPGGGELPMATIERLRLKLALLPLFSGRVELSSLVLERPVLALARLPDGRPNWHLRPRPAAEPAPEHIPSLKAEPPSPEPPSDALPLHELQIENGMVTWQGKPGEVPVKIDAIDGRVEMGGKSGPFALDAQAKLKGAALTIQGAIDRIAEGRGSPASLAIRMPGTDAQLNFQGLATHLSGGETLRGRLVAAAPDPAKVLTAFGLPAMQPPGPFSAETELSLSTSEISAADMKLGLGPMRAGGMAALALDQIPRLDVHVTMAPLDLDSWPRHSAAAASGAKTAPAPTARSKPEAAPPSFALPDHMFANVEVVVDSLTWHGRTLRNGRVDAVLDQGEIMLRQASAELPGGGGVAVDGTLSADAGQPVFDGRLNARTEDLRPMLAWAGIALPETSPRRLELTSPLHLSWPELRLNDFKLGQDAIQARGSLAARLEGRPAFALSASVNILDLDTYAVAKAGTVDDAKVKLEEIGAQPGPSPQTPAAPADSQLQALAGFDAEMKLTIQRLIKNRLAAEAVSVDGSLTEGVLVLRQFSGEVAGSRLRLEGRVADLAAAQPRLERLAFTLNSSQPARLARFAGANHPPALLERLGALNASGTVTGDADRLAVDARAESGGLELTAKGNVTQPFANRHSDLVLNARHASAAQALRLVSPDFRPKGQLGAFALDAKLVEDHASLAFNDLSLALGQARLGGQARLDKGGARPVLTAQLNGNAIDLTPFLAAERTGQILPGGPHMPPHAAPFTVTPAAVGAGQSPFSSDPLDLSVLNALDANVALTAQSLTGKGWRLDGPAAQITVQNGTAILQKLTGKLLGGDLTATARLAAGAIPALSGQFSVLGADLGSLRPEAGGIAVTQGRLDGESRFITSGRSSQDMAARLNGDGRVLVRDGVIDGFDLGAVNQRLSNVENVGSLLGLVQAGLSGGRTPFSQLTGTFRAETGIISSRDVKLDAQGGGATAQSIIDLPRWTTNTVMGITLANSSAPPLSLRLEGPLDNPRKIIDVNALQQYLVARGLGRALKGKDAGDQPGEKPSGKTILNDFLKGLGGR